MSRQLSVKRFISVNRNLSQRLERLFPCNRPDDLAILYSDAVVDYLGQIPQSSRVVDLGAGRRVIYADQVRQNFCVELVGIDVDSAELKLNQDLDRAIATDVLTEGFPDGTQDAAMITSMMVLEHVVDLETTARQIFAALRPGGFTVHMFSGRNAPFAVINRLLPEALSTAVLATILPEKDDECGFHAFYDRTDPLTAREVFKAAGFEQVNLELRYRFSPYLAFFVPAFVVARVWETILERLNLKSFASYILLTAYKPGL